MRCLRRSATFRPSSGWGSPRRSASKSKGPRRDLRVAAGLGLLGGPFGLLYAAPLLTAGETLALSAGACSACDACTYPSGQPCRQPHKAMASLESYGIDVAALIERAGLSYTNGPDTVSYVGVLLY